MRSHWLRTNCKSLQEHFNIQTDISTFGKVFGSGYQSVLLVLSKKLRKFYLKKIVRIF